MLYSEITSCRSCGSKNIESVLSLGNLAISDFILPGDKEERAPLELMFCSECSLVQLRHTVDRDFLYKDNPYWYKSGVNESMVEALKDVVLDAIRRIQLEIGDRVLDLGANDGTLLSFYPRSVQCDGYEPAEQLLLECKEKANGRVFPDYFPPKWWLSGDIPQKYKIITSIAHFYNVEDVNRYVRGIKAFLHPDGICVVQMQDLEGMITSDGFDNICHEHLHYWGWAAFSNLLAAHNLEIETSTANNTNGRSMRYIVRHASRPGIILKDRYTQNFIGRFAERAEQNKAATVMLLEKLKAEGKTVLGVAASTKANTLLQYYGIGPELLPAIAERSTGKIGRMTVGTHIPIISEEELRERKPDYLLCLAWGFFDSFQRRYQDMGASWIKPLPTLEVIQCPSIREELSVSV